MTTTRINRFVASSLALFGLCAPLGAAAQIQFKKGDIVVMEPTSLPEAAQLPGDSLFLNAANDGSFYLYVEQQQGARLVVFDVSDPAHIKVKSVTSLGGPGAFDFVQPLSTSAELVRYREGDGMGVLDLKNARHPSIQPLSNSVGDADVHTLGAGGFLAVSNPVFTQDARPKDFLVFDTVAAGTPALLTTVRQVTHQTTNQYMGTTFLSGDGGLTVVRRLSAERDYTTHQQQMSGN